MWWKQSEIAVAVGMTFLVIVMVMDVLKTKRKEKVMAEKTFEEKMKLVRKLRDAQLETKDTSDYQEGYYNGLELACSILEDRSGEFHGDEGKE